MEKLILGIGSNLGNRINNLQKAIYELEAVLGPCFSKSSAYQAKALNHPNNPDTKQSDYLNAIITFMTNMQPEAILELIVQVELNLKRTRSADIIWGPRIIDIDIIMYGSHCILKDDLVIPHQEMLFRDFVLKPLLEIEPDLYHPLTGNKIQLELSKLKENFVYGETFKL